MVAMSAVTVVVTLTSLRSSQRGGIGGALTTAAPAGIVGASDGPTALPAPSPTPSESTAPAAASSPQSVRASPVVPSLNAKPSPTRAATTTTVNGASADTQYGPVQVQVSIRGHRIFRADAIDYPQGSSRDQEINSFAIPQLDQETLSAQRSSIDTVSGATYTSDGYRQSLQSALDAAHRAGAW